MYKFKDYLESRIQLPTIQLIYNHVQNFYPAEQSVLENSMIVDFYSRLLQDPYYQFQTQILKKEILSELKDFYTQNLLDVEFDQLDKMLCSKPISVHDKQEALEVLNNYYSEKYQAVKTLPFELQSTLTLIVKSSGTIESRIHSPLFGIQNGELTPLTPISQLYYDSNMELQPLKFHRIAADNGESYVFSIQKHHTELRRINMKNFSLIEKKKLNNLQEEPFVFLKLKKIENTYIKAKTDPFYKDLISNLQEGYQKLLIGHPEATKVAQKCMQEARVALNNVYSEDRLLLLLTANIEYHLRKQDSAQNLL